MRDRCAPGDERARGHLFCNLRRSSIVGDNKETSRGSGQWRRRPSANSMRGQALESSHLTVRPETDGPRRSPLHVRSARRSAYRTLARRRSAYGARRHRPCPAGDEPAAEEGLSGSPARSSRGRHRLVVAAWSGRRRWRRQQDARPAEEGRAQGRGEDLGADASGAEAGAAEGRASRRDAEHSGADARGGARRSRPAH